MEDFLFYSVIILWFLQIFTVFLLVLLFRQFGEVYLSTAESIKRDGVAIGEKAPDHTCFSYTRREEVTWSSILENPAIIAFVSPDCKPCREMLSHWNTVQKQLSEKIQFILVFTGDDKKVRRMIQEFKLQGEIILDRKEESFHHFKVRVTPFAFAVEQDLSVKDKGLCGTKEHLSLLAENITKGDDDR
ncbi:redoxin domain-containing protein [Evansella sp. LMS18]|jgi:methylamine dehydrogenase accessory protein MauD|uniref:redoxin domain-containing protein n=1 Tax=Evansella sp. LMS18 TaxID=2924033 RepID=UPI0020D17CA5|nr:redoxin domain-containing protein [Evansella sp. LMS18]UTR11541.1 redoxin domain-containing protein [Evansella sp. LMS18]